MAKTILKTFRLPADIIHEIESGAERNNLSQAQYIVAVFSENKFLKLQKIFLEDMKRMENDEEYKQEQHDLAEADFL